MSQTAFQNMPFANQINCMYRKGEYITSVQHIGRRVNLYLIGTEYYEAFLHPSTKVINKIRPLDFNSARFDKYLDQIDLPVI